jgi:hypothetical protein
VYDKVRDKVRDKVSWKEENMPAKSKANNTPSPEPPAKAPKEIVQQALQVTWQLKGQLKNIQLAYIRAGAMLVKVRDERLYAALGHPDLESYAQERLQLGRSSLYRYLRVYDWIAQRHPEWLAPKVKGGIPPLDDAENLIWIEEELAKKGLRSERKKALEELKAKALDGRLTDVEMAAFRRRNTESDDAVKSFLSRLRLLRRRGAELDKVPPEVLADLDAAITALSKAVRP